MLFLLKNPRKLFLVLLIVIAKRGSHTSRRIVEEHRAGIGKVEGIGTAVGAVLAATNRIFLRS